MIRNISSIENIEKIKINFWSKVDIKGKDNCWNWLASKDTNGYGSFKVGKLKENTHRVVYVLCYNEIVDNLWVLHKCDNRLCCNPNHLFLGTYLDNIRDMEIKGRRAKGDNCGLRLHPESIVRGEDKQNSRFTEKDIENIYNDYFNKILRPKEIKEKYNLDRGHLYRILHGETWSHVAQRIYPNGMPPLQY